MKLYFTVSLSRCIYLRTECTRYGTLYVLELCVKRFAFRKIKNALSCLANGFTPLHATKSWKRPDSRALLEYTLKYGRAKAQKAVSYVVHNYKT